VVQSPFSRSKTSTRPLHDKPVSPTAGTPRVPSRPAPVAAPASPFFSKRLLEDRLVQAQIRHQSLQLAILLAQLPKLPQLCNAESAKVFSLTEERGLTDAQLSADLLHRRPHLRLPQRHRDLLFAELALAHPSVFSSPDRESWPDLQPTRKRESDWTKNWGGDPCQVNSATHMWSRTHNPFRAATSPPSTVILRRSKGRAVEPSPRFFPETDAIEPRRGNAPHSVLPPRL